MNFNAMTAFDIVSDFYKDKKDLNGKPAEYHPMDVAGLLLRRYTSTWLYHHEGLGKWMEHQYICAMLHDLVEDCQQTGEWTFDRLQSMGCQEDVITALKLLTHWKGTDYFGYIRDIIESDNQMAINAKIADLECNLVRNGNRFPHIYAKHQNALRMFREAGKSISFPKS